MTTENKQPKNAVAFNITFRDKDHFYRVVSWLNANVGHGKKYWTVLGRVLRNLHRGKMHTATVQVFDPEFDESNASFLSLL